jgi:multiple sugar transport system permease protein
MYWMVDASFTTDANLRKSPPDLIPLDGTLAGYRAVLSRRLPYLGNSLLIGLLTVALTSVVSAPAGHALAKLRPKGGGILSFPLLAAQMIPGVILAMGLCAILLSTGWINTIPGLVVADSTIAVPFAVFIFTAFMSAIPEEPLQAAATDGAPYASVLSGRPSCRPAETPSSQRPCSQWNAIMARAVVASIRRPFCSSSRRSTWRPGSRRDR